MVNRKLFTQEQISDFNANPYTHKATEKNITFTREFKEFFYAKVKEGRLTSQEIFREAGYDPDVFGKPRMDSIRYRILHEAESPEGIRSPHGLSYKDELEKARKEAAQTESADAKIQYLESRVSHLEAQIEFLKKTAAIRKKFRQPDEK